MTKLGLTNVLKNFSAIGLEAMNTVSLLKRVDTKFVLAAHELPSVLQALSPHYHMLAVNNISLLGYTSLYFDTPDHQFYKDHHNGKIRRSKVRIRRYDDANLLFLEVKNKTGRGNTQKVRQPIADFETTLSESSMDFININILHPSDRLVPSLWNSFQRITLVDREFTERATIDIGINYSLDNQKAALEDIVIIEVKQSRLNRNSILMQQLRKIGVTSYKISKYCLGMIEIHSDLKYNRFKEKQLKLINLTTV